MLKIYWKEIKKYSAPMKILATLVYMTCLLFPAIIVALSGFFAYHIGRITFNTYIFDKDMVFTCFGGILTAVFALIALAVIVKTIVLLLDEGKCIQFFNKHLTKLIR